ESSVAVVTRSGIPKGQPKCQHETRCFAKDLERFECVGDRRVGITSRHAGLFPAGKFSAGRPRKSQGVTRGATDRYQLTSVRTRQWHVDLGEIAAGEVPCGGFADSPPRARVLRSVPTA